MFKTSLKTMLLTGLMLSFLTSCAALNLGPETRTVTVIVRPGHALKVTENATVQGVDDAGNVVKQDIGGWMAMPEEHFQALMKALDAKK